MFMLCFHGFFCLIHSRSVSTGYVNVSGTTLIGTRSVCTFVLVSQWALIIRYYKMFKEARHNVRASCGLFL